MIFKADAMRTLECALSSGADFAELFLEDRHDLNIPYNSGVQGVSGIHIHGVGLYLLSGQRSAYVYTSDTSLPSLLRLCKTGGALLRAQSNAGAVPMPFNTVDIPEPNPVRITPSSVPHKQKIRLLQELDKAVRSTGADVRKLENTYFETDQHVAIINSEGVWAEDRRVSSRIRMSPVIVQENGSVGYFTEFARPAGFEAFEDGSYIQESLQIIGEMRTSLCAEEAPSGCMPVVLAGGDCSGTFFHEACGHQFESQRILSGSAFAGKIGQKVASDKVTLIDDGTLPSAYGSSKFDDEGMPRQKNIMIENGIMKSYLCDRLGARKLNVARTGSGRRQGYTFAPSARMSNTYLAPGTDDTKEMIRSMPLGLYVTRLGGGNSGKDFTILAQTAYLVKNGTICQPVKGAILLGRGDETMLKIDRVGNSLVLDPGGAFCGNVSGLVNTSTSGAALRIAEMLVGGKGGKL